MDMVGEVANLAVVRAEKKRSEIRKHDLIAYEFAGTEIGVVLEVTPTRIRVKNWLFGKQWIERNAWRHIEKYGRTRWGRFLDWVGF